jgi:hypothetical protein
MVDERPVAIHLGGGWMVTDHDGITQDPSKAMLFEGPDALQAAARYVTEHGYLKAAQSRLTPRQDFNMKGFDR